MNKIVISLLVIMTFLGQACKKGDAGPKGVDGNANVIQLNYGPQTFTGIYNFPLPDSITQGRIDSSLVLMYYVLDREAPTTWYPVPGLGSGGNFETRSFVYQSGSNPVKLSVSVRIMMPNSPVSYPTPLTFSKTRILIIPASKVMTVNGGGLDLQHYGAVRSFLNLDGD